MWWRRMTWTVARVTRAARAGRILRTYRPYRMVGVTESWILLREATHEQARGAQDAEETCAPVAEETRARGAGERLARCAGASAAAGGSRGHITTGIDRKSTRLNSSHSQNS